MSIVLPVIAQLVHIALVLAVAPTLLGVSRWMASRLAGRAGPPILQPWHVLARLARKQTVLAENASPLFRVAPLACLAVTLAAAILVPSFTLSMAFAPLADLLAIGGLLALGRVILALAAMDAGTAPGGLAAGRTMTLALLAEPSLLLVILTLALLSGGANLDMIVGLQREGMLLPSAASALAATALVAVAFTDLSDPAPWLEREFTGRDLALIQAARALRLLVWLDLIGALFLPIGMARLDAGPLAWGTGIVIWALKLLGGVGGLAVLRALTGLMPSSRLPDLMGIAVLLALVAAVIVLANAGAA